MFTFTKPTTTPLLGLLVLISQKIYCRTEYDISHTNIYLFVIFKYRSFKKTS